MGRNYYSKHFFNERNGGEPDRLFLGNRRCVTVYGFIWNCVRFLSALEDARNMAYSARSKRTSGFYGEKDERWCFYRHETWRAGDWLADSDSAAPIKIFFVESAQPAIEFGDGRGLYAAGWWLGKSVTLSNIYLLIYHAKEVRPPGLMIGIALFNSSKVKH